MKITLTLVILFCAQLAMAEVNFDPSSGKSKFRILLDAYQTASKPADYPDFPGEPVSTRKCVVATRDKPDYLAPAFIAVKDLLITPAVEEQNIPAQGPLFPAEHIPGKPAVTQQVLIMGDEFVSDIRQEDLKLFKNNKTPTDFVITVPSANSTFRTFIRSKDGFFPFAIQMVSQNEIEFTTFAVGYCY